ncbi:trans-Golgi network integral membrane protein TGN38-like isoform X1 [Ostrinia nubilalis]|uniref:trans-Golgi network integral membrane protein TGN38-like isoform X1 n=1 Tax=Ostrinia nubilalis TaxID=29057 RepID=UPI00308257C7
MFRYFAALILVTFYSKSSGAPANGTDLSTLLSKLASTCENQFISTQITSKLKECHVNVPPYDEKKIQCMLFYDINKQLCTAVGASKLALTEDFSPKIKKEQDVSKLCIGAKDWQFTDLGEVYKKYVNLVFTNPIMCARVCSVDNNDFMNVESNFYCKYFKWGAETLKLQVIAAPTQSGSAAAELLPTGTDVIKKPEVVPEVPHAQSGPDVSAKDSAVPKPKPENSADIDVKPEGVIDVKPEAVIDVKPDTADSAVTSKKANPEATANAETNPELPIAEHPLNNIVPAPTANPEKPAASHIHNTAGDANSAASVDGTQNNPIGHLGTEPGNKPERTSVSKVDTAAVPKKQEGEVAPNGSLNSQLGKPNANEADPDDYQNELDSEEVRNGISDNQGGDDGDDQSLGEADLKPDPKANKNMDSSISQFNVNDMSQKEYYPSDAFPEDDDHFFSFFLTAIIMVVLLYILYHNKSKVSKVIMGLIVEGRQPGRRRNSRGHAYKRLDTLEQAMSANSATPPSKIIY